MGRFSMIRRLIFDPLEVEMAVEWLAGRITIKDISEALGKANASNVLAWVGPRLKEAARQGRIIIKDAPQVVGER